MYEHHSQPVLPRRQWLQRLAASMWLAFAVLGGVLLTGILGYHFLGNLEWIDSLLEASMILGGMGPVAVMQNDAVKIFASFYALLSGCLFLTSVGIVVAPILHRLLHRLHHRKPEE
jgi:hypothetical protein